MITNNFEYEAEVIRWIDGDTCELKIVQVDYGFGQRRYFNADGTRMRLWGINCPERNPRHKKYTDENGVFDEKGHADEKKRAIEAMTYANRYAPPGSTVRIKTYKDPRGTIDKSDVFGRYLAEIYVKEQPTVSEFRSGDIMTYRFGGMPQWYSLNCCLYLSDHAALTVEEKELIYV